MKNNILFFLFIFCFFFSFCNTQKKEKTPLDNVFMRLETALSEEYIKEFKEQKEEEILQMYHNDLFGIASIYVIEDEEAIGYLGDKKRHFEHSLAPFVLISWHRKLNSKPIWLHYQLKEYTDNYKNSEGYKCSVLRNKNAKENYNKYNVKDTVNVFFPVRVTANKNKNGVIQSCPIVSKKELSEENDLFLKGIVINKEFVDSSDNYFYIKILSKNRNDTPILLKWYEVGDTLELDLNSYGSKL